MKICIRRYCYAYMRTKFPPRCRTVPSGLCPMRFHESFEVSVDRPIFIIGINAPADPDHTPEIVVVPATT